MNVTAYCPVAFITYYPQGSTLNLNSNIIIQSYGLSNRIVFNLNKIYPIYLESEQHRIKLKVIEINEGMDDVVQAVLKPEELLSVDNFYQIKIENLTEEDERHLLFCKHRTHYDEKKWKVINYIDNTKPILLQSKPFLKDNSLLPAGCGDIVHNEIQLNYIDDSKVFAITEFFNIDSNITNKYILNYNNDSMLLVGHGMCGGEFKYNKNLKYKVRFKLMDISGNESINWSDWLEIDPPFKNFLEGK